MSAHYEFFYEADGFDLYSVYCRDGDRVHKIAETVGFSHAFLVVASLRRSLSLNPSDMGVFIDTWSSYLALAQEECRVREALRGEPANAIQE